jgi:hypothetical protein
MSRSVSLFLGFQAKRKPRRKAAGAERKKGQFHPVSGPTNQVASQGHGLPIAFESVLTQLCLPIELRGQFESDTHLSSLSALCYPPG